MINEYDQLSHSESSSDLPQTLRDQIDAMCDFDPFAPVGNSQAKHSSGFSDPITSFCQIEDQPQLKVMQKLGIFGEHRLTEISEEASDMEISEMNLTRMGQNKTHLKANDSLFKLNSTIIENDIPNCSSFKKNSIEHNEEHFFKSKYDECENESENSDEPDKQQYTKVDIDMNCMSDFTVNQSAQNIGKIEIINNNNYYININGKDLTEEIGSKSNFKKKTETKIVNKKQADTVSAKNKIKEIIDNTAKYSNSSKQLRDIIHNVNERRNNKLRLKVDYKPSPQCSHDNINAYLDKSHNISQTSKTKHCNNTEVNSEHKTHDRKRGNSYFNLYTKNLAFNASLTNIYKKRNSCLGSQKRAFASIDNTPRRGSLAVDKNLSRADSQNDSLRSYAFRNIFSNDNSVGSPLLKKTNLTEVVSDKHRKSNNGVIKNKLNSVSPRKSPDIGFKFDKHDLKMVLMPASEPNFKRVLNLVSRYRRKESDIKPSQQSTTSKNIITDNKKLCSYRSEKSEQSISHFSTDVNHGRVLSKFAAMAQNHADTTCITSKSTQIIDVDPTLFESECTFKTNTRVDNRDTKSKSSKDNSLHSEHLIIDYGDVNFKPAFDKKMLTRRQTDNFSHVKNFNLKGDQFQSITRNSLTSDLLSSVFKSSHLKNHTLSNELKGKKMLHGDKSSTNFVEKNKHQIEKSKGSNYEMDKVYLTNQKFFDKVKMMSKI